MLVRLGRWPTWGAAGFRLIPSGLTPMLVMTKMELEKPAGVEVLARRQG